MNSTSGRQARRPHISGCSVVRTARLRPLEARQTGRARGAPRGAPRVPRGAVCRRSRSSPCRRPDRRGSLRQQRRGGRTTVSSRQLFNAVRRRESRRPTACSRCYRAGRTQTRTTAAKAGTPTAGRSGSTRTNSNRSSVTCDVWHRDCVWNQLCMNGKGTSHPPMHCGCRSSGGTTSVRCTSPLQPAGYTIFDSRRRHLLRRAP